LSTELDTLLGLSTQALDLDTQAANLVIAGPTTGAAAKPTARALVEADLPFHSTHHINRLAGITATLGTFDMNPTTPLNMTDGDWTTATGEGIKSLAGANGDIGFIMFDMGAAYPVLVIFLINAHRASGDGAANIYIESSNDNVNWYNDGLRIYGAVSDDAYKPTHASFLYARYLRLHFYSSSVTVNPSVFHVKVAEVQALQLL
jgi:hypothetical protein